MGRRRRVSAIGTLKKLLDTVGGQVFSAVPALRSAWARKADLVEEEGIPFARLGKPLAECRLGLVTTAGLHHPDQPAFDMDDKEGDPSFRRLDLSRLPADFTVTHDYYPSKDVLADPNIVLPYDRARELVEEGRLGALHGTAWSLMGHLLGRHLETLQGETAPAVAREMREGAVDIALLTPA